MSNKYFLLVLFFVLFLGLGILSYLCYNNTYSCYLFPSFSSNNSTHFIDTNPEVLPNYKIAFISDSHENSDIFLSLKDSLKVNNVDFIIHAGDLTNYGTLEALKKAKADLDFLSIPYYVLPGDHDVAETGSIKNFSQFFNMNRIIEIPGLTILFIPNYFNFTILNDSELNFLLANIGRSDIIVASQPIYVPESNIFYNKYMGSLDAFDNLNSTQLKVLDMYNLQRIRILDVLRESNSRKIVISGDHHRSSSYTDPNNSLVSYHNLGSLAKTITFGKSVLKQTSLQSNRYSIIEMFVRDSKLEFNLYEVELR